MRFQRAHCFPKPLQAPGIPIIAGGHTEAAARAGRIGDGFYPAAPPHRVAELARIMQRSAEKAGRDPAKIEITARAGPDCDADTVKRYQDLSVARVTIWLPIQDPADLRRSLDALYESLIFKVSLRRMAHVRGVACRAFGHA